MGNPDVKENDDVQVNESAYEDAFAEAMGAPGGVENNNTEGDGGVKEQDTDKTLSGMIDESLVDGGQENKPKPPPEPENKPDPPTDTKTTEQPLKQAPEESDESFKQRWLTLQGIHRHDKDAWDRERAELLAKLEANVKQPEPPPDTSTKAKSDENFLKSFLDSLTPEQKEALAEYDEEFDVVSKMEGLKRDTAMSKLREEIMSEITALKDGISTQLAPAKQFIAQTQEERDKLAEQAHFSALSTALPDFERYRDDGSIVQWIESKPAYLRKGMIDVYQNGSTEEAVSLLSDFRVENNINAESNNTNSNPDPSKTIPEADKAKILELDERKNARKQALSIPDTRRSAVNQSVSQANNFDDAFDEAMHSMGG